MSTNKTKQCSGVYALHKVYEGYGNAKVDTTIAVSTNLQRLHKYLTTLPPPTATDMHNNVRYYVGNNPISFI